MKDETESYRQMQVFWTSENNSKLAIVPGVNNLGNRQPIVRAQKTKDVAIVTKPHRPSAHVASLAPTKRMPPQEKSAAKMPEIVKVREDKPRKHNRGTSLRDLCSEDKQRVANLIKEIAKLNQEKDSAVTDMSHEREEYEKQIRLLLAEKNMIVDERERIERLLVECQALVSDYQTRIMEQQEKILEAENYDSQKKHSSPSPRRVSHDVIDRSAGKGWTKSPQQNNLHYNDRKKNGYHDNRNEDRGNNGYHDNKGRDEYDKARYSPTRDRYQGNAQPSNDQRLRTKPYSSNDLPYRSNREVSSSRDGNERYHGYERDKDVRMTDENRCYGGDVISEYDMRECDEIVHRYREQYDKLNGAGSDDVKSENRFERIYSKPFFPERSFTQAIDRELEKQGVGGFEPRQELGIPDKPRPPLEEPVFSSTPWNVDETDGRASADLFQPLVPERTLTDVCDHLDDRKFLSYYKKLTPKERKEQLVAQKEALLREQNRLREVLRQQEVLLAQKQLQLKRQQEEQTHRLKLFEKTGYFPDNGPVVTVASNTKAPPERPGPRSPAPSHVSIATSPIKSVHMTDVRSPQRNVVRTDYDVIKSPPKYVDIGTEMTQHGPTSNKAERSLSVLEIVDSLEEPKSTPPKRFATPTGRWDTPHSPKTRPGSRSVIPDSPVSVEDLEESRVLEEVFFLNK